MFRITAAVLSLTLICCNHLGTSKSSLGFKDSILREYFAVIDSLELYDTTNYDFRTLKAFFNDDTSFFEEMAKDIKVSKEQNRFDDAIDSCVQLKKISELNADEVYRFSHSESFCFYSQRVTISRTGDSILLHYLEFSASPDGKVIEYRDKQGFKRIGPGCKVEKEFSKVLSKTDWDHLENKIRDADYWGMKQRSYEEVLDGSWWQIDAFTNNPREPVGQRTHTVGRKIFTDSFRELGHIL